MGQDTFHFRQFSVCHRHCAMKVGTDGVLLGALAAVRGSSALDIGTGSGLVALMLAQRSPQIRVTAIDIDTGAVNQAADNFRASPWPSRLTALQADVVSYEPALPFDTVVCNPPYYEHSPAAGSETRQKARVADRLTHEQLAVAVGRLLAPDGCFSVILPYGDTGRFAWLCWQNGLFLRRRVDVCTKYGKPYKRSVLIFDRTSGELHVESLCLMNGDGTRSEAYGSLTEAFYLR